MIAIDLGSNTIRVLKINCQSKERIYSFERAVKTADGLYQSKKISNEAKERIIKALLDSQSEIDFFDDEIIAVTTEALRQATNSKEILDEIFEQTKVRFQIISPEKEAELTLLSAKKSIENIGYRDNFILIDIGGGSTELTFYSKEKTISQSFRVGIVTLAQKYEESILDSNLNLEFKEIKEFIDSNIDSKYKIFVATAGTPTTVANMKLGFNYNEYDYKKITGTKLSIDDLDKNLQILINSDQERQIELVGENRADLIVAGVLIYKTLFELLNFKESIVIDDGLREGVAIAKCLNLI